MVREGSLDGGAPGAHQRHGASWEALKAEHAQIAEWVKQDLLVIKMSDLLARRGVVVPYRTLHRLCTERCGFGRGGRTTMRVTDGEPGTECQIGFARVTSVGVQSQSAPMRNPAAKSSPARAGVVEHVGADELPEGVRPVEGRVVQACRGAADLVDLPGDPPAAT